MHVVFFIGNMVSGGAERVIQLLSNHFVQEGWDVDIALLLGNKVNYEQFPLDKRITIIDLSEKDSSYRKNAHKWLRSIRNYAISQKPDCIVSFVGRINALVLTATIGLRIPVLVSERNDPKHDGRSKAMQYYCNSIYRRASAIVFQTRYEQSCFSKKLYKKSHVIPNPVSVADVSNITEEPLTISTASRLVQQKNHSMLIDAMREVADKMPDARCYIYGDGELRDSLEQKIKELKLEGNVILPGNKTNIHPHIAQSSIFVMTSEFEGLSNALIEAMMLGKACIVTDYPGVDEVIINGKNGIIVSRGDSRELADKILELFENSKKRKLLASCAKENSVKYEIVNVISEWKTTIENCCHESV